MADSFFDPTSWTYSENPSLNFGQYFPDVQSPDINTGQTGYDFSQPSFQVSTGATNQTPAGDSSLTGALGFVRSTGQTLLDAWGMTQQLALQKSSMDTARQLATGQLSVQKANADVGVTQAQTAAEIERLKAQAQVAVAQNQANAAKSGTVYVPAAHSLSLGLILAAAAGAYVFLNARRGKK